MEYDAAYGATRSVVEALFSTGGEDAGLVVPPGLWSAASRGVGDASDAKLRRMDRELEALRRLTRTSPT